MAAEPPPRRELPELLIGLVAIALAIAIAIPITAAISEARSATSSGSETRFQ